MAENAGTAEAAPEAQTDEAEAKSTGTPAPDEVTTLRSRNAGLDAKVSSLTKQAAAHEAARVAAEQKLADYEAGKVGNDEALRAQLQVEKANTENALREAKLARIEARYPETYKELGEDAANMSQEKLAAVEARLAGVAEAAAPVAATKPIGNNQSRTQAAAKTEETFEDVAARLKTMTPDW